MTPLPPIESGSLRRSTVPSPPLIAIASYVGFVLCVLGANWFIGHVGEPAAGGVHTIPVGWGWQAPSGVIFVGVALTLRDLLQNLRGARWTLSAIVVGAVLSAVFNPRLALASGTTFMIGELADYAVYTPLRRDRLLVAIVASNVVGALVDSILFLGLAFGIAAIRAFALPQVVGKIEWSLLAIPLVLFVRPGSNTD